jgi:hypothetical protein
MLSALEPRVDGEVDAASTLEGTVVVEPGAKVVRSRLLGPVIVGANALVEDSTLGPDVALAAGCVAAGSTRCCHVPRPETGSQPSSTAKTIAASGQSQKFGIETPASDSAIAA